MMRGTVTTPLGLRLFLNSVPTSDLFGALSICEPKLPNHRVTVAHFYSYRKDSIGSSRAAFQAGHNPKTMPIPTLAKNPANGAHSGT